MNCYICKTALKDGDRVCSKCGAEQWKLPPAGLREDQYRYSSIETVVQLLKWIDEEDYLISLGYGQGWQYYDAVIEDYKRSLPKYSWVENDAGSRRFHHWKKESHEIYKKEYEAIDILLNEREKLKAEIDRIECQKSIKWLFCSKRNAIKCRCERLLRIKDEIERLVSKIYK